MSGLAPSLLAALRLLRAPLSVLCAMLLFASTVPHAMAGTAVCTGWAVSVDDGDGGDPDGAECPFCSAAALALPYSDASALVVTALALAAPPLPEAAPRAMRARAPPMGPRAPPAA